MTRKVILWAAVLELPFIFLLWLAGIAHEQDSSWFVIVATYQIVPLSIATAAWYLAFGHGAPPMGWSGVTYTLYFVFIFVMQVLLSAAIAEISIRMVARVRARSAGPPT